MYITHKIRIYPNKTTINEFNKYFGYSRFCYNRGLELWKEEYKKGNKPNFRKIRDICKLEENKLEWEKEYSTNVLDTSLEDLSNAYKRFFNKKSNYPRYKSKKREKKSFRIHRKNDSTIRIIENKLYLPKFKYGIKLSEELRFKGRIQTCTISCKADQYFVSITLRIENSPYKRNKTNKSCGIDLGIKNLITLDNGKVYNYPAKIESLQIRINILQKKLSKKVKGSNKYNVMKTKLQKAYLDLSNLRDDFLHKITTKIIRKYDNICIENLNNRGMLKNKRLSNKLYNSLFYKIRLFLELKSNLYGNNLILAKRNYPSTQRCNRCGNIKKGRNKLTLSNRTYKCRICGYRKDRDVNAALNLKQYGLSIINS